MTDQKAQELTDTKLNAALAERDKADKVSLTGRNVGSGAQRKRSANLPIKTLAERDKPDKAAKALLRWPECGERLYACPRSRQAALPPQFSKPIAADSAPPPCTASSSRLPDFLGTSLWEFYPSVESALKTAEWT